jgi:hypothetical protein
MSKKTGSVILRKYKNVYEELQKKELKDKKNVKKCVKNIKKDTSGYISCENSSSSEDDEIKSIRNDNKFSRKPKSFVRERRKLPNKELVPDLLSVTKSRSPVGPAKADHENIALRNIPAHRSPLGTGHSSEGTSGMDKFTLLSTPNDAICNLPSERLHIALIRTHEAPSVPRYPLETDGNEELKALPVSSGVNLDNKPVKKVKISIRKSPKMKSPKMKSPKMKSPKKSRKLNDYQKFVKSEMVKKKYEGMKVTDRMIIISKLWNSDKNQN